MMIVALLASLLVNTTAVREPNLTLTVAPRPAPVLAAPALPNLHLPSTAGVQVSACANGAFIPLGHGAAGNQGLVLGLGSPLSERRPALALLRFGHGAKQSSLPGWDTGQVTCRSQ